MAIIFHERSGIFHLTNDHVSYLIRIMENGQLENLYYGKKIRDREDFSHLHDETARPHLCVSLPDPSMLSMQYTRQEYPVYGTGDYRTPALTIRQENGSRISVFTYESHTIQRGKPALEGLPATYTESDDEAETLEIRLFDKVTSTALILSYTLFESLPVIARHARICQEGDAPVLIERAMSCSVEFLGSDFEMVQLSGAWARERYVRVRPLEIGLQGVQGLAGTCGGAEENPFLALKRPHTTEQQGEVYGFSLVYSGNFLAQTEVSPFDMTRVLMGISPESFAWKLEKGETFTTPEVVMVWSDSGLNGMSQVYHRLYRRRLARGYWRDRERPILLNNWEGTYFDFNEEKLLQMARKAKEAGVELFVLDDGWFGERNDDFRGLGDWFCNTDKIPSGIGGLSRKINEIGLKFGLWVELEMINMDSDLYRAHPDFVLRTPDRYASHSRHQHVLDFTRQEVVDHIHDMIAKILRESEISYIKWDMNRYMTEPFSAHLGADRQGEVMHRYMLGVYSLYERLTSEFPQVLFESCASGGARFDPGMLYYAPQAWCSDDTDANERCKIQYGTSMVYPLSMIGSHVSAVPNHQLSRTTPLETRGAVAMFGTFGYELDLDTLSPGEMETVKNQIIRMKKLRRLIQTDSDFYRLLSPFEGNETGWICVSGDKSRAAALLCQRLNKVNASWLRFKLAGLEENTSYRVTFEVGGITRSFTAFGDELMYAGIPVEREDLLRQGGDFAALFYELEADQGVSMIRGF
jgi:alpha-galactosidase